jgi:hypothetical protein
VGGRRRVDGDNFAIVNKYYLKINFRMDSGISGIGDDTEAMRRAFESFMLSGKNPINEENNDDDASSLAALQPVTRRNKKKKNHSLGISPPKTSVMPPTLIVAHCEVVSSPSVTAKQYSKATRIDKKKYYQLLRTFNDKVHHIWFDVDDQILPLLQNIVSLRSRLPIEWKLLQSSTSRDLDGGSNAFWKSCGFLGRARESSYPSSLFTEDIQLALANDLTQHEKMLASLRALISEIAECHDALGRVVDTLWKIHCSEYAVDEDEIVDNEGSRWERGRGDGRIDMENILHAVTDVFQVLSIELYRKQGLILLVIESAGSDGILGIEHENRQLKIFGSGAISSLDSLQIAHKCCSEWARSNESFIKKTMKDNLFGIGNNNDN